MKVLTPIKAILAKCVDCCCGQQTEARLCPSTAPCTRTGWEDGQSQGLIPPKAQTRPKVADSPTILSK